MGFFSKFKKMVGITGLKIEFTKVESPFPFGDSIFKAQFELSASEDLNLLSKTESLIARRTTADGQEEEIIIEEESTTDENLSQDEYPRLLKANEVYKDGTCLGPFSISEALAKWNVDSIGAVKAKKVKFFFKVEIDVKETVGAFDPSKEVEIQVQDLSDDR